MKNIIFAICICLIGCSEPVKEKMVEKKPDPVLVQPPVLSQPTPNPFEKPAPQPLQPTQITFQNPDMKYWGEVKMNERWNMYIWRDESNKVICYFVSSDDNIHNMSCVKQ